MKKFARLLNSLYFTYGHLDKMTLLEQFFSTTPDPERGYALAIMANTLNFPVLKRSLIKELISERMDPYLLALSNDYVGDLSETISLLWTQSANKQPLPLLSELILKFNELSKPELKAFLSHLLDNSDANERWALLKLATNNLRIGISSRFLKKTLAHYGQVDIRDVEQIWHGLQPPYTELFAWLEKKGTIPISNETCFFHPVMLSHPLNDAEILQLDLQKFIFERKYDGIRVQVVITPNKSALYTRTGDDISHTFPDVLASIQDWNLDAPVVLDGELIIAKPSGIGSFNELQKRLNRKTVNKQLLKELPAGLVLYDLLWLGGIDLRPLPFLERRSHLEAWLTKNTSSKILISDLLLLKESQTLHDLRKCILEENNPAVEGLMIKNKQSPYIPGRPKGHWYKWKRDPLLVDAVLMYAQRGHGKRSSYYSDFTFGLWEKEGLLPIGKAYFGFTDEELLALDKWVRHHILNRFGPVMEVKKALVLEIAFDAVNSSSRHKSGVALRFPRVNRIRWDKPAEEADKLQSLIQLIS
ncbi:MAG: cisplatin damage response ATP-dependent DNA ligase [Legionella sp.]|nr:cisplatin damage response ATP-dependent DNA ligase [Legionella sp.]